MMGGNFRIARIAGIGIDVHYTWVLAFLLITWSLAAGFYPAGYPGWSLLVYWLAGVVSALCLFGSVLLHELAHSFVAMARGLPVGGITLFIFGGVSSIQMEDETAKDEFVVSLVGPVTSLALAGLVWIIEQVVPSQGAAGAVLGYLVFVNVLLALFNLLPGFPLDGGRVLRAILWGTTGNFYRATNVAAGVGRFFAFVLIVWGVLQIFSGNVLNGLWIAFIGWFLSGAADASRQESMTREGFRGIGVRDLMDGSPETVAPDTTVYDLVYEHILRRGGRALPVCEGRRLVGIVSLTDVKDLERERWPSTRVAEIMVRDPLYSVQPSTEVTEALRVLAENGIHQVLVTEDGNLVGVLTRAHIVEQLQLLSELGLGGNDRGRSPSLRQALREPQDTAQGELGSGRGGPETP